MRPLSSCWWSEAAAYPGWNRWDRPPRRPYRTGSPHRKVPTPRRSLHARTQRPQSTQRFISWIRSGLRSSILMPLVRTRIRALFAPMYWIRVCSSQFPYLGQVEQSSGCPASRSSSARVRSLFSRSVFVLITMPSFARSVQEGVTPSCPLYLHNTHTAGAILRQIRMVAQMRNVDACRKSGFQDIRVVRSRNADSVNRNDCHNLLSFLLSTFVDFMWKL